MASTRYLLRSPSSASSCRAVVDKISSQATKEFNNWRKRKPGMKCKDQHYLGKPHASHTLIPDQNWRWKNTAWGELRTSSILETWKRSGISNTELHELKRSWMLHWNIISMPQRDAKHSMREKLTVWCKEGQRHPHPKTFSSSSQWRWA